jgi:hypothetical protein
MTWTANYSVRVQKAVLSSANFDIFCQEARRRLTLDRLRLRGVLRDGFVVPTFDSGSTRVVSREGRLGSEAVSAVRLRIATYARTKMIPASSPTMMIGIV